MKVSVYLSLQYHHWLGGPGPRKTNMGSKTVPNRFNFSEMCFIPLVLFMRNWRQPPPVCLWPKWKLAAEHGWASLAFWPWCPAKYCHLMCPCQDNIHIRIVPVWNFLISCFLTQDQPRALDMVFVTSQSRYNPLSELFHPSQVCSCDWVIPTKYLGPVINKENPS